MKTYRERRVEGAEALAHELQSTPKSRLNAHLLPPGFVFTGLTAKRTGESRRCMDAGPDGRFHDERLAAGDFYILCPDNDIPHALDDRRILCVAGDIVEHCPAARCATTCTPDVEGQEALLSWITSS